MKYLGQIQNPKDIVNKEYVDNVIPEMVEITEINIDNTPTEDSDNLVTSGGVYEALQSIQVDVVVYSDTAPTTNSLWWDTYVDNRNYLCFTSNSGVSTIATTIEGNLTTIPTLEYSADKENWTDFTIDDTEIILNEGDKVYFRGDNNSFSISPEDYVQFEMAGSISASGNVMSLVDSTCESLAIPGDYCFYGLFAGCETLTTAPELPATTLAPSCYSSMFRDCSHLTTAPELPAIELANSCYENMFQSCTSLETAPELPATALAERCYTAMFYNCTSLTSAPELPATTLAEECYIAMFSGCASLETAPELPATALADYCYQSMFYACSSLATAPELPATTLAESCYSYMFSGCTSLTTAPELPAIELAEECYSCMFDSCTSLETAPELPATILAKSCYYDMFDKCSALTTVPELPATILADSCYETMFSGCTSLTIAPELPATTLAEYCYSGMFYGCTNINHIKVNFTEWNPSNATNYWIDGVASTGTFECPAGLPNIIGPSNIPNDWTVVDSLNYLCFTGNPSAETNGISTITMITTGSLTAIPTLEYSLDSKNWTDFVIDETEITLNEGDKVYFRGDNNSFSTSYDDYVQFVMTGSISASGNIMSLVDKTCESLAIPSDYCFCGLFIDCTSLTSAPELPATELTEGCYGCMFIGCESLTIAPQLPATTLAGGCYSAMFDSCASLTSAPELPATELDVECYSGMFFGCTSLTSAPELPATTLADYCYQNMFSECESLEDAPELPATELDVECYSGMFFGCTSLTSAPELPAIYLSESCYSGMFKNCTNLTYIKVNFTEWTYGATQEWLYNVSSTGTFECPSSLPYKTGITGIPKKWTVETF